MFKIISHHNERTILKVILIFKQKVSEIEKHAVTLQIRI